MHLRYCECWGEGGEKVMCGCKGAKKTFSPFLLSLPLPISKVKVGEVADKNTLSKLGLLLAFGGGSQFSQRQKDSHSKTVARHWMKGRPFTVSL